MKTYLFDRLDVSQSIVAFHIYKVGGLSMKRTKIISQNRLKTDSGRFFSQENWKFRNSKLQEVPELKTKSSGFISLAVFKLP